MVDFVEINGARLAYRICGPDDAPLMITLHGGRGMGDHRSDFAVYSHLGREQQSGDGSDDNNINNHTLQPRRRRPLLLRVLSFDFRGHGQSSRTKPYTFEQIVDDVEGLRRHFAGGGPGASSSSSSSSRHEHEQKVIICGGSFGGFLAQRYAIKYAGHVSHLILRGTAPSHHHEEGAIETLKGRLAKAPSFSEDMLRNKVFGAYESDLEFQLVHFASMPLYTETFDPDKALKSCLGNVYVAESHNDLYSEKEKYFDYTDRLNEITAKTLVIVGDQDWICPPDNSKTIAARVPNAELFIVEGANHSVHIEKPELVLSKIRSHIAQ